MVYVDDTYIVSSVIDLHIWNYTWYIFKCVPLKKCGIGKRKKEKERRGKKGEYIMYMGATFYLTLFLETFPSIWWMAVSL